VERTQDIGDLWNQTVALLNNGDTTLQQKAFLKVTQPLGLVGDTVLLAAPNEFTKDFLETRLRPLVVEALSNTMGRAADLLRGPRTNRVA
jgi:chromosomal replication initiator protein